MTFSYMFCRALLTTLLCNRCHNGHFIFIYIFGSICYGLQYL